MPGHIIGFARLHYFPRIGTKRMVAPGANPTEHKCKVLPCMFSRRIAHFFQFLSSLYRNMALSLIHILASQYTLHDGLTNSMAFRTRRFNVVFKRALHKPYPESNQFLVLIPISFRSILILSYPRLCLLKGIFHLGLTN